MLKLTAKQKYKISKKRFWIDKLASAMAKVRKNSICTIKTKCKCKKFKIYYDIKTSNR
jgi:hypothetical protein